jgi:hypothetical protein
MDLVTVQERLVSFACEGWQASILEVTSSARRMLFHRAVGFLVILHGSSPTDDLCCPVPSIVRQAAGRSGPLLPHHRRRPLPATVSHCVRHQVVA